MTRYQIAISLTCGLVVAACGSSGKPSTGVSPDRSSFLAFSRCMRAHGVPKFPDPRAGGGGIQISGGAGVDPSSPAFQAAQATCQKLLPGGGPGARHATAQDKAQMLQISQCMRQHGISSFPDPTLSPPSNPRGYSAVLGRNGVFLAIPNTIDPQSPAFKQAATACRFPH